MVVNNFGEAVLRPLVCCARGQLPPPPSGPSPPSYATAQSDASVLSNWIVYTSSWCAWLKPRNTDVLHLFYHDELGRCIGETVLALVAGPK